MSDDNSEVIGPIDFVLLEFPDQHPTGEAAAALLSLVDNGTIRLYDITAIRKAADGAVSGFEVAELDGVGTTFSVFAGARSGLIGDDDIAEAAAAMEPGTIAVLLVYENTWATPFIGAAHRAGGQLIASARLSAQSIIDRLDALDAQT